MSAREVRQTRHWARNRGRAWKRFDTLLDRLTHHVSILTMNGDSYCLEQSVGRRPASVRADQNQATAEIADPDTGEITAA